MHTIAMQAKETFCNWREWIQQRDKISRDNSRCRWQMLSLLLYSVSHLSWITWKIL